MMWAGSVQWLLPRVAFSWHAAPRHRHAPACTALPAKAVPISATWRLPTPHSTPNTPARPLAGSHVHGAGMQASALLAEAGLDPSASRLVDAFSRQPTVELPGARTVTALSSQTQWSEGGPLTALLLSTASPGVVLPAPSTGALSWLVRGKLVVCAGDLPAAFVSALLTASAKGVLCRATASSTSDTAAPPMPCTTHDCCAFFTAFYDALLSGGGSAVHALRVAEAEVPKLSGMFVLHSAS